MNASFNRWSMMGENADNQYKELFGENGAKFVAVLENAPYEIAIISKLLAYLQAHSTEDD